MKKLQMKTAGGWAYVFCRNRSSDSVTTTQDKTKALPQRAIWAADDLAYFQRHFANDQFRLAATLEE